MSISINSITPEHEALFREFYSRLDEPQQREYAGTLSLSIGRGGQTYVARLFGISRNTVRRGEREILSARHLPTESGSLAEEEENET